MADICSNLALCLPLMKYPTKSAIQRFDIYPIKILIISGKTHRKVNIQRLENNLSTTVGWLIKYREFCTKVLFVFFDFILQYA